MNKRDSILSFDRVYTVFSLLTILKSASAAMSSLGISNSRVPVSSQPGS